MLLRAQGFHGLGALSLNDLNPLHSCIDVSLPRVTALEACKATVTPTIFCKAVVEPDYTNVSFDLLFEALWFADSVESILFRLGLEGWELSGEIRGFRTPRMNRYCRRVFATSCSFHAAMSCSNTMYEWCFQARIPALGLQ